MSRASAEHPSVSRAFERPLAINTLMAIERQGRPLAIITGVTNPDLVLLYQKQGDRWSFSASSYQKLRLNKNGLCDRLSEIGLQVIPNEMINRMVCIIAKKI